MNKTGIILIVIYLLFVKLRPVFAFKGIFFWKIITHKNLSHRCLC
jgi:hypothetical protein